MADKKITELPNMLGSDVDDSTDVLAIVDTSADTTNKITRAELFKGIDGNVGIGVSSPSTKLDVNKNSLSGDIAIFRSNGAKIGNIGVGSANAYFASSVFGVKPTGVGLLATDTSGGAQDGVYDIGNNAYRWKDLYLAGSAYVNGDAEINGLTVGRGSGGISTNVAVGADALSVNTTGSVNTAVGTAALTDNTEGSYNTAVGRSALGDNTTGSNNTASGYRALVKNTTGSNNVATGSDALFSNTTGNSNVAVGRQALYSNTTGGNNTASGYQALYYNTTGNYNVASGYQALFANSTAGYNTAIGYEALHENTTGGANVAVGYRALYYNTTGDFNVAVGRQALFNNNGSNNTASGVNALYNNTTGSENVAIGREALNSNTTGSGNFGAAFRNSSGVYAPVFDPTTHSNRVVMGHTGVTNAYVQVAWTVVSDARDKTEIESLEKGLDFVEQLNPVSYKFRKDRDTEETTGKKRYGFLAQEVLEVEGDDNVIVDTEDLDKLKMTHEELIPVLVKAIQELKAEVDLLKAQ